MKDVVITKPDLCIGCRQCEYHCPIESAIVFCQDEKGGFIAKTDEKRCVACGRCISVCPTKARCYTKIADE